MSERNIFHQVLQTSGRGVDPELLPYLEEAEEQAVLDVQTVSEETWAENDRRELMRFLGLDALEEQIGEEAETLELESESEEEKDTADSPLSSVDAVDESALEARFAQVVAEIFALRPEHDIDPTVERVKNALRWLGDPHQSYPVVQVGGTNGKTSTARIVESLLAAQGLRVGCFTSPHLVDVCERIRIAGQQISHADFLATYDDCMPVIELAQQENEKQGLGRMSFFELLTVLALQAFAFAPVDAVVLEVGMGGRWDSTNVVDAEVSVLAPIDLDHQEYLGSTLEQIAFEKVGIIKPGASVISAPQAESVQAIIEQTCERLGARLLRVGRELEILGATCDETGQNFTLRTPSATYTGLQLPLRGEHQLVNAALALGAVEAFNAGKALQAQIVEEGLLSAQSPGRLELVKRSPQILVDAAHNPHGARALRAALERDYGFKHLVGVFSAMRDKDFESVLGELEPVLDQIVVVQLPGERGAQLEQLELVAGDVFGEHRVWPAESIAYALERAVQLSDTADLPAGQSAVVAFGSVQLVGLVKQALS